MSKAKLKIVEGSPAESSKQERQVIIAPPKFEMAAIHIVGTSPYVQHRFSQKARNQIVSTQEAGSQAKKGRIREAKDFTQVYKDAQYLTADGQHGIPASAFRNALISACRTVGFRMTLAKLSLFVEADALDGQDGTPLVLIKGEPQPHFAPARNANGSVDVRCRPMWTEWEATVRVRWDAAQFSASDVANLMARVGLQIGIGEGRPDSRMSAGLGWGLFRIEGN